MIFETQDQLDECLVKWQKILRLQDWDVKAKVSRRFQMARDDVRGSVHAVHELKAAAIELLDPVDSEDDLWPLDHEKTLVHELLHLYAKPIVGWSVEQSEHSEVAEEQMIDCLAVAFVTLDRR